jgi:uncharacterized damage-inducible protein DinB
MDIEKEFMDQSILRLNENTPRIEKCLDLLTEKEVWQRPNKSSNSIGNLIVHLCGNITQYIISSLGETKDMRNRDEEFNIDGKYSKTQLLQMLQGTVNEATDVIGHTDSAKLIKVHSVQGFELSGIGIIIHVVEHYSYHTGQISFFTKLLKDKDLGYYADLDLNTKNELDR